ncbi:MAG: amidohydrolase family protein [Deltaproteobacteria bacterium]|nr:amidohydrolase family protein [Deltaproteobacteria bacterium]
MIIDAHAHVFPGTTNTAITGARRTARKHLAPIRRSLHGLQPLLRYVPESVRRKTDDLSCTSVFSSLLIEGTPEDLLETLGYNQVDKAVVIASPPHSPNDYVLALARKHPQLIPVVNVPPGDSATLAELAAQGARGLKIHAAIDGEGPRSPHYLRLLGEASDLGLPVVLHTGCIHMKLVYKDPEMGRAERFKPWFTEFPRVKFVLAHMNFHEPDVALDLCLAHENLLVDTSWQPPAVIKKAVRKLGAERVLFATDWPLVGDNVTIGLKRIEACTERGISPADAALVLGENAARLFKVEGA